MHLDGRRDGALPLGVDSRSIAAGMLTIGVVIALRFVRRGPRRSISLA